MAACKLLWCPKDLNELARFMDQDLRPLLESHLVRETERTGVTHSIDVPAFMAAWEQRGIALIMAYDGNTAVGFMPVYIYRPLWQSLTVGTVERWEARTTDVARDMFSYLQTIVPVIGLDQVHICEHDGQAIPAGVEMASGDDYCWRKMKA